MKNYVVAFVSGLVFSIGLGISGMVKPSKVIGFLDFFGDWDPSLAFVMGGAVCVNLAVHFLIVRRREAPVFDVRFHTPSPASKIDGKLLGGAAIFGVGWGLGGFCPGPALTTMVTGAVPVLTFVAAMVAGMFLYRLVMEGQRS